MKTPSKAGLASCWSGPNLPPRSLSGFPRGHSGARQLLGPLKTQGPGLRGWCGWTPGRRKSPAGTCCRARKAACHRKPAQRSSGSEFEDMRFHLYGLCKCWDKDHTRQKIYFRSLKNISEL
ncbi:heat shock factor-binding protein 1-like protein 1 isoform X1 [Psammomys obesus]|uniref:heat shock factor-binding protein 1-like protein 1 isoform X1 n=1 Tax=Psammomys obesus TaxID=48139 RepID=UPI002452E525|nr:heat shock factor-binding protein 1-like protein 1 isoform X1 [Psammomys obesus]XP_055484002.1 heat shock factor-binding protein 1-like protein 1 isoform X1 [Psammomys obesus]